MIEEKGLPIGSFLNNEVPKASEIKNTKPIATKQKNANLQAMPDLETMPEKSQDKNVIPEESKIIDTNPKETKIINNIPEKSPEKQELPPSMNEENCVVVGKKKIEIKPTKLKYFRNKAASGYSIIKMIPLHELLTYGAGVLDKNRDADSLLFDFLVAAFDDAKFIEENYNELDADTLEKILKIFGRINHIDEKEEAARKNKEAQAANR